METKREPSTDIYLTKDEISKVLVGLNFSMEKHYAAYDTDLPEDLIRLVSRFMDLHNNFIYCYECRTNWVKRWSDDECKTCPKDGEE